MRVRLDDDGGRIGEHELAMTGVLSFYDLLPDGSGILTHKDPETRTVRYIRNWQTDTRNN